MEQSDKKSKKRRHNKKKAQTNRFLSTVNVGQTVKLLHDRIGFVRFKGNTKFGVGIWYGLELYDSINKTRHNGTVYGRRYFSCPRNKGLFVKRDRITEVIKPQHLKQTLKELERRQIERKKLNDRRRKIEKKKSMKQQGALALYQSQTKIAVVDENGDAVKEEKIKNDFKRFQRLSFMASNNPEIARLSAADNEKKEDEDEKSDEIDEQVLDIDIDSEAWDSLKERPIIQMHVLCFVLCF